MISKNSILKNLEKYLKRSFKGKVRINESSLIAYLLVGGFFCFVSNVGYATVAGKEEIKYQNNGSKTEDGLAINFAKALGNSQTIAIGGNDDDGGNGNAIAKGEGSIAIGGKSRTEGSNAVAVGVEAAANEGATALGAKSKSLGTNSIALGLEAEAKQNESIAIGHAAKADELHAISMGYKANAKSQNGISIGAETVADGQNSIVIGKGSKTSELTDEDGIGLAKKPRDASVVIGVDSVSKNQYTITMGHRAQTLGQDSFAFGNESKARKDRAIAFGERTIADGENSMALGSKAGAYTVNTLAFGAGAQAKESQAISIGNKAHSNGENSISIGTTSLVGKVGQYGMSTGEKIVKNGTAIGGYSNVDANGGTTIGSFTTVNNEGGVALGIDSIANVAGGKAGAKQTYSAYNSTKAGAFTSTDTYKGNMRAGVAPRNNLKAGAVSVGKADGSFTRQIVGLAAGTEDTDAVNVAQLKSLTMKIEGDQNEGDTPKVGLWDGSLKVTAKGTGSIKASTVVEGNKVTVNVDSTDLEKKIQAAGKVKYFSVKSTGGKNENNDGATADNAVAIGKDSSATEENSIALGSDATTANAKKEVTQAEVQAGNGDKVVYNGFAGTKPYAQLSVGSKDKERQIKNVAAGEVSASSTDAVNGSQLYAVAAKPMTYTDDKGTQINRLLGQNINLKGGAQGDLSTGNIAVEASGTDTLNIKLAKNLKEIDSISKNGKAGSPKITLGDSNISFNSDVDMGSKKITNVATPTSETDAANKKYVDDIRTTVQSSDNSITVTDNDKGDKYAYDIKVDRKNTKLSYKANGGDPKETSLETGLNFTGGNLITASAEENGTIKYDIKTGKVKSDENGKIIKDGDNGVLTTENLVENLNKIGWKANAMAGEGGKLDGSAKSTLVKMGDEVVFAAGKNLIVKQEAVEGKQTYTYSLSEKLEDLTSVTTKNTEGDTVVQDGKGITITPKNLEKGKTSVSLTKDGLNNGGNKITNVAEGTEDTDAVNKSQLDKAQAAATTKVEGSENIQVDKTPEKDGSMTYTVKTKDKMTLGKDSDKKIVADGETGKLTVGKEVEMDGTTGDARFGKVQVNGKEGTVGGLTNTTWDKDNIVSGQAATEDQLQVLDKKMQNNTEELINKGMDFSGNDYDAKNAKTKIHKKLGDRLEIIGGLEAGAEADSMNLRTRVTDDGKLELLMAKNPKFKSVEAGEGDTKVTIGNTGIQIGDKTYITKDGINANGNKITNVAEGTEDTDAVNKSQLDKAQAAATTKVEGSENIQVDKTPEKDGSMTYTVKTKDKMTLGKDSDKKIVADGETGKLTVGKEVEMDGTTGDARFGKVQVNGEKGTVGGLTNKTWDKNKIVSGQAATEDQLKAVDDKVDNLGNKIDETTNKVEKGLNFAADTGKATNRKLGDTLTIAGDNNNITTSVEEGKVKVALKEDVKVKTLTSETVTTDKLILKGKDGKTTDVGETLDKHDKDIQENKNAIKKGLNFAANHGEVNKQLGDTMSIKGKDGLSEKEIEEKYDVENIVTSVDKEGNLWIKMAKNPKFKSVEAGEGDTKVTIGDIGIKIGDKTYITKDGINANDNKIKNVADGKVAKGSKDAINGGQLHDALSNVQEGMNQINHRVDKLDDRMHRGLANAAAMSTVEFLEIGINQATVGAAIGTYRGNQAVAVGVQAAPTENMRVHAKVSVAPSRNNTETMAGVGASWRFNIK